jgi:hypothetical protein
MALSQCRPAANEGLDRAARLGLRAQPGLRVSHERLQLVEQVSGWSLLTIECFDPIEPVEHLSCLVHASTVPAGV